MLLEPRLREFAWYDRPKIDKAEDEKGHSLLSAAPGPRGSPNGANVPVILDYPEKPGTKIAFVSRSIVLTPVRERPA